MFIGLTIEQKDVNLAVLVPLPDHSGRPLALCSPGFPSARPSVTKMNTTDLFRKRRNDFDANWHKESTGQRYETIDFGGQEVKGQGHERPEVDLEVWWRRHSRPLKE